jgi:long-chain fatty acid transport protein
MKEVSDVNASRIILSLLLGGMLFLLPLSASAGGLFLTEFGTPDVGLAGAGWAARAQDASTLFKNPAGMTLLEGNQFQGGVQLLYGDIGFTSNGNSTPSGGGGGNPIDVFPGASGFYVHPLGDDWRVGFGIYSNFGLGLKYRGEWVGRYYVKDVLLAGVTFMPTASYRVNEYLSIGGGLNVMVGAFKQTAAVNNLFSGDDGELQIKDRDVGVGGNIGVLLMPVPGTRFGISYQSPIELNFSDKPEFSNLGPIGTNLQNNGHLDNTLDLGMTVPQSLTFSAYHELTRDWAMMGNLGWQDWSRFGKVDVTVSTANPISLTADRKYRDTWHVAIGTQYRVNPAWVVSTGFAYDSSMVKDKHRTLDVPVGETYKFGLGALWQAKPTLNLGFSYELAWGGDMSVDQNRGPLAGRVAGEFKNTALHFFAVTMTWGEGAQMGPAGT